MDVTDLIIFSQFKSKTWKLHALIKTSKYIIHLFYTQFNYYFFHQYIANKRALQ